MTFEEQIALLNDAENTLLKRRATTPDTDEKTALTDEIERIRLLRDQVSLGVLLDAAVTLNALAGTIENATAALKTRPFDGILAAYQGILDRIGKAVGDVVKIDKPAAAIERGVAPQDGGAAAAAAGADAQSKLAALYKSCKVEPGRVGVIDRFYIRPLTENRALYEQVGDRLGIPWWFIGVVHGMEASFNLETHLHNGDPLQARTVRHPPGRPRTGAPPFTWLESAIDALTFEKLDQLDDWSIGKALDRLERYNGLGYRRRGLPSPYLWSFSNHYEKGKFVADGHFDPDAVSKQCGGAVLLKRLDDLRQIDLKAPLDAAAGRVAALTAVHAPAVVATRDAVDVPDFVEKTVKAELKFPGVVKRGAQDSGKRRDVHRVQEWVSFHGSQTAIDGDFGGGTETSVQAFQNGKGLPTTGIVDERTWAAMTEPMHRALRRVSVETGDTIYDVTLKVARQHLAEHPIEFNVRGQGNHGPWVRLYMLGKEGDSQPWCAGFVCHVIGQAAHAMGIPSPLKRQVGVDELVKDAKADDRYLAANKVDTASLRINKIRPGSLFAVRKSARDWTHVGIVTHVTADQFSTIEGNTNDQGVREGFEVCARSRGYKGRDFLLLV